MFGKVKWLAAIVVVLALGAVIFFGSSSGSDADGFAFRTAKIERGIVATTVSASGNLKAVITVEVGAQVTGMVKELMADFNTPVKANQVIARIDPSIYEARVAEATGDVATARASVNMQKSALVGLLADIRASEAALEEARRDIERQRELLKTNVTSRSQVDKSQSGFDQAKARLDSIRAKVPQQQAQIEMAHAQMVQREAILQQRKLDLSYTFIRSPVDGVVINRSVDVGQTVAASLQTPVLFTIAQDLRQMQVQASVDEADIGKIRDGQQAEFTVDAYPGRRFPGVVEQVRKQSKEVSNVITYTVVVAAKNPEQLLLPGMTANVVFTVGRRDNVLKVPTAAVRFKPPAQIVKASPPAPGQPSNARTTERPPAAEPMSQLMTDLKLSKEQQDQVRGFGSEIRGRLTELAQRGATPDEFKAELEKSTKSFLDKMRSILDESQRKLFDEFVKRQEAQRTGSVPQRSLVWVEDGNGMLRSIEIMVGISDSTHTEIVSGDVKEGMSVVISATAKRKPANQPNPGPRS